MLQSCKTKHVNIEVCQLLMIITTQVPKHHLIRLEAARHAVLIDAAAAVSQAAFTNVLPGTGSIDVAAAINQQVFPLADITCKTLTLMSAYTDRRQQNCLMELACYRPYVAASKGPTSTHQVRL